MHSKLIVSFTAFSLLCISALVYGASNKSGNNPNNNSSQNTSGDVKIWKKYVEGDGKVPNGDCLEMICANGCVEEDGEFYGYCCPSSGRKGEPCSVSEWTGVPKRSKEVGKNVDECCAEGLVCSEKGVCDDPCAGGILADGEYLPGSECLVCYDQNVNLDYNIIEILRSKLRNSERQQSNSTSRNQSSKNRSNTKESEDVSISQIVHKINDNIRTREKNCEICDSKGHTVKLPYNEKCQICENFNVRNKYNECQVCDADGNITNKPDFNLDTCHNCVGGNKVDIYPGKPYTCGNVCCSGGCNASGTGCACAEGSVEQVGSDGTTRCCSAINLYSYKQLLAPASRGLGVYDAGVTIGPYECDYKVIMPWWSVDDNVCIQGDSFGCKEPDDWLKKWHTVSSSMTDAQIKEYPKNRYKLSSDDELAYILPAGKRIKFKVINKLRAADGGNDSGLSVSVRLEPTTEKVTESCGGSWFTKVGSCHDLACSKSKTLDGQKCCIDEGANKVINSTTDVDFSANGEGCCPTNRWLGIKTILSLDGVVISEEEGEYCCPNGYFASSYGSEKGCCPVESVYIVGETRQCRVQVSMPKDAPVLSASLNVPPASTTDFKSFCKGSSYNKGCKIGKTSCPIERYWKLTTTSPSGKQYVTEHCCPNGQKVTEVGCCPDANVEEKDGSRKCKGKNSSSLSYTAVRS